MRIGLVGAGRIGRLHALNLRGLPEVGEILVADLDRELAREVGRQAGATAVDSVGDAVDGADALVISASTNAHPDLIRAAVDRDIPTFCEKPLASDLAESIELSALVDAAGIPFHLGFQRRLDAGYREARRLVETGAIGTLYLIRLAGHDATPPPDDYIPVSGGLFRDCSIHDFDAVRFLTGAEVDEVYAIGAVRAFDVFAKWDDVDTAVATLRMSDGALVTLDAARHDPLGQDVRAEIFGSKDSVAVGLGPRTPLRSVEPGVAPPEGPAWDFFLDRFAGAYQAEMAAFVDLVAGRAPSPCSARDGVEALRIAEAASRALREGRPVRLEQIPA